MRKPSPLAELQAEHARVMAMLDALNDTVDSVRPGGVRWEHTVPGVAAGAGRLQETLLLHFRKEEEALFPGLLTLTSEGSEEAGVLAGFLAGQSDEDVSAHTAVRLCLRELQSALARGEAAPGPEPPAEIHDALIFSRDLLRRHHAKEERIIFPLIERLLQPEQMADVQQRMASIAAAT